MSESPTVFFSHSMKTNRKVVSQLVEALKSQGYAPSSDFDIGIGESFEQSIRQMIERSDFVIADLTGNNANVMYEVGFAQGLGKSVLPIVQESERQVSAHIAGMLYVPYDPQKPDNMIQYVLSWVKRRQPEPQHMAS
ncbi:MAG: toll/interleukin-1 receptor domain-containing protein [Chloroflexota bacterium]|nr:toll/interleukin-1 receptor domain-containing protein [Anaerolineae bacterium]